MQIDAKRKIGNTGLFATAFGFGAAPLGNIFRPISDDESVAMVHRAWESGVRTFDTAPMYGHGLSELRLGHALRWKPREEYTLISKVGRRLTPAKRSEIEFAPWVDGAPFKMEFDYTYDGTIRAFEDSLQRLGLESIDVALIHDIDVFTHGSDQPQYFRQAMDGAAKALIDLKRAGKVEAIGVGVNEWEVCLAALKEHPFDCFLLAGRYTLLEQNALDDFLPLCAQRRASVFVGGGFNSGILATGATREAKYNYAPAPDAVLSKVRQMEQVCAKFDVKLPAAALQFVIAHPQVASFVAGTRTEAQLNQNLEWFTTPIPNEFWVELKARGLLREDAPTPQGNG